MASGLMDNGHIVYNAQNGLPWHRMGIPMDGASTPEDVFTLIPRMRENILKVPAIFEGREVPGQFWIVEETTRKIVSGGTVGAEYQVLQRTDLVRAMARMVQEPNGPVFETAMLLWDGRKEVIQARMPEEIQIKGRSGQKDILHPYIVGSNGHDGWRARFATGIIRVVCANTEASFFNNAEAETSTWFKHSGDIQAKLDRVGDVIGLTRRDAEETQELFQALARREMTQEEIDDVVKKLIPDTKTKRAELQRERVLRLNAEGRGNAPWEGTAWGLFNAFTELEDWFANADSKRPDADDMRVNSTLFGSGMARKEEVLRTLAKLVK